MSPSLFNTFLFSNLLSVCHFASFGALLCLLFPQHTPSSLAWNPRGFRCLNIRRFVHFILWRTANFFIFTPSTLTANDLRASLATQSMIISPCIFKATNLANSLFYCETCIFVLSLLRSLLDWQRIHLAVCWLFIFWITIPGFLSKTGDHNFFPSKFCCSII